MATAIKDIFEKLRSLQEVLSRKYAYQSEMEEIPKVLATKTELLNRMKKGYLDKNSEVQAKTTFIAELRNRAIEAERAREKYEQQMDLIQTQREYEVLDKEIKDAGEKEQEMRRDLQKEEKLLEEMKLNLQKEELMIQKQEEEVKSEQEKIKSELKAKGQKLKGLEKEEKKIIPGLDDDILFKFERIIKNKSGLGIVPIEQGVCTGCHMILTFQYVNEVRMGKGIMFCPNCSRILFFQEEAEAAPAIFEEEIEEEEEEAVEEESEEEEEEEESEEQ